MKQKLNFDTFSAYLKTVNSQFTSNKEILNNKIKEPSRSISLTSMKEQLENIQKLITSANENIIAHNTIVANYTSSCIRMCSVIIEELKVEC